MSSVRSLWNEGLVDTLLATGALPCSTIHGRLACAPLLQGVLVVVCAGLGEFMAMHLWFGPVGLLISQAFVPE